MRKKQYKTFTTFFIRPSVAIMNLRLTEEQEGEKNQNE